jgi:hypothetical protein
LKAAASDRRDDEYKLLIQLTKIEHIARRVLSDSDPKIAKATSDSFEPGVPATGEGVASGGAGFLLGGGLTSMIGRAFRRRPRLA